MQTNGIVSPLIMRGVGKNRVLLLVDGVPQNDNFNNGIAWVGWGHIPKDTIERIEIVRGPTSALYGSEGLGGVIHIITQKPGDRRKTGVQGQAGSGNTYGGSAFHSQKFNDFGVLLSGGYEETDGFYMVSEREDYEIKRYRDLGRLLGKIIYDIGPASEISLAALYYDYKGGQGREYFYNEMNMDQYWLNFNHQGDSAGIKGLVYLNRVDKTAFQDTANDNFSSPFRDEKMKGTYTWGADLQSTLSFKLGIAYHPDDRTTLRASGGKGFRAPSLFELYKVHIRGGGTMYREANPELKPELIWSYDLGAERFFSNSFWGKFTFYQSWAKDYIGSRLLGSFPFAGGARTRNEYVLDNISQVDIYGFHVELQWEPIDYATLFGNYTYNISKGGLRFEF